MRTHFFALIAGLVLSFSLGAGALAQTSTPIEPNQFMWMCTAEGIDRSFGGGRSFPVTVDGFGDTLQQSQSDALSNCMGMSLSQCSLLGCRQINR